MPRRPRVVKGDLVQFVHRQMGRQPERRNAMVLDTNRESTVVEILNGHRAGQRFSVPTNRILVPVSPSRRARGHVRHVDTTRSPWEWG